MIRALSAAMVAAVLLAALCGCGEKSESQTSAIPVENPVVKGEEFAAPPGSPGYQGAEGVPAAPAPTEPAVEPRTDTRGFTKTKSGLMYKDIKTGRGAAAKPGDRVTVNYKGWLDNGTVFDSSYRPGRQPFTFTLGRGEVIKGWDEGIAGMKAGGTRELIIPPDLAYGSDEQGVIPPNSTLNFRVEMIKIGD